MIIIIKPKKEWHTAYTVLIVLAVYVVAFITAMIVTYWTFQSVPEVLIQYALGAGGVEALLLAVITVAKVLTKSKTEKSSKKTHIAESPKAPDIEDERGTIEDERGTIEDESFYDTF